MEYKDGAEDGEGGGPRRGGGGGGGGGGRCPAMGTGDCSQWVTETVLLQIQRSNAHHGCANDYKGHRPIFGCVIDADGSLVLGEHVDKGRVDGNGVHGVEAARHVGDAGQCGSCQEVEPMVVL